MIKHALVVSIFVCGLLHSRAELPGTGPIIIPEKGLLEKDHQALRLRWAEKHLLPEAEKRWKGKPWAGQARAVTADGFKLWLSGQVPVEKAVKPMIEKATTLMKAGCEEPLACLMAHKILFWPNRDWRVSEVSLTHSLKIVDDAAYPGALRAWVIDERIDLLKRHHRQAKEAFQEKQAERIATALKDQSYSTEFEAVLVRDFLNWMDNLDELDQRSFELLKASIESSTHSEWAKNALLTEVEIQWAWRIRSGKWAHLVQMDAWKGFNDHLELAAKHAQKAWELRPDRPEAAAKMVTIVMGQSGGPIKLREWFDRAVKAQFDYASAYSSLAKACSVRWGGSDQFVLSLGCRFAETKRYDTFVPAQLFYACKLIAVEQANARMVFSQPSVRASVVEFAQGTLDHHASEPDPSIALRQRSLAAISAWLAGDDALAFRALKATGGIIDRESAQDLSAMLHHFEGMKISVLAGSGEWGEQVKSAELYYRRQETKKAQEALAGIEAQTLKSDAARAYVEELRAVMDLPAKLAKGGWQPLPVHPGLATCLSTEGDWRVTRPGEVTLNGSDVYQADLVFPLLSAAYFELRGEVSVEMPPEKDWLYNWVFSPVLHWQPERFSSSSVASCVRGVLYKTDGKPPQMALAGKFYTKRIGEQETQIKPVNSFHLKVDGPKVDYSFNGVALPSQVTSDLQLEASNGLVALAGIYIPKGGKVVIRKLEVRNLR